MMQKTTKGILAIGAGLLAAAAPEAMAGQSYESIRHLPKAYTDGPFSIVIQPNEEAGDCMPSFPFFGPDRDTGLPSVLEQADTIEEATLVLKVRIIAGKSGGECDASVQVVVSTTIRTAEGRTLTVDAGNGGDARLLMNGTPRETRKTIVETSRKMIRDIAHEILIARAMQKAGPF